MAGWIGMTEGRKMPLAITRIYFENPLNQGAPRPG